MTTKIRVLNHQGIDSRYSDFIDLEFEADGPMVHVILAVHPEIEPRAHSYGVTLTEVIRVLDGANRTTAAIAWGKTCRDLILWIPYSAAIEITD